MDVVESMSRSDDGGTEVRGLRFCFQGGFLAYDYARLDYPKVYLLDSE